MKLLFRIFGLSIAFVFAGCYEGYVFYLSDFNECHQKVEWDSTKIARQLIGKWRWDYIECDFDPQPNYKGLVLDFEENGKVTVFQNELITQESSWQVIQTDQFYLETQPNIFQTTGFINFCEDHLLFNNTENEGCAYRFTKV